MFNIMKQFCNPETKTEEQAERAGFDCAINGSNLDNCHFSLFATQVLTQAWERGKERGERLKRIKRKQAKGA